MKEEFKKVMTRADACLDDSKYLFEGKRYEAAVNRAYYAMLTAVQALLLDKDIYVKTHSGAKAKFHEHFIKTNLFPLEFGKIYENAFDLRQDADYDFETEVPSEAARQTIDDAAKFLEAVKSFLEKQ